MEAVLTGHLAGVQLRRNPSSRPHHHNSTLRLPYPMVVGHFVFARWITQSAQIYWQVADAGTPDLPRVYPEAYRPHVVGMLWSTLAQMQTWFGAEAWKVYGIQASCLSVSLYLHVLILSLHRQRHNPPRKCTGCLRCRHPTLFSSAFGMPPYRWLSRFVVGAGRGYITKSTLLIAVFHQINPLIVAHSLLPRTYTCCATDAANHRS